MARPVKKQPEEWEKEILDAAKFLFLSKGYEETSVSDIMERAGGAKGMFYRFFESKEKAMQALGDRMFLENNPFEAVRARTDLNGLQKIREVLAMDRADGERETVNAQAVSILKDPRILAAAMEANRRVLTPLWFALIEEGRRDGSIQTEHPKELAESCLVLLNLWAGIFSHSRKEFMDKFEFLRDMTDALGVPVFDQSLMDTLDAYYTRFSHKLSTP